MTNPARTIELLDALEPLGFDNKAFALLHHFRIEGHDESIARQRSYCLKTGSFQSDGENERLQRRLALVLDAYRS